MAEQIRIQGRPQTAGAQRPSTLGVQARPINYGMGGAAPDADLMGLMRGLESFNPALQRYGAQQQAFQQEDDSRAGRAAALKADLTGADPNALEPLLPPAYSPTFAEAFKATTGDRLGIQVKADLADEFAKVKDTEGFNPAAWLAQKRQKVLAGINDPVLVDRMGRHFGEVEQGIMGEVHRENIRKREAAVLTAVTQVANDAFDASMAPSDWAGRFHSWFADQAKSLQMDPRQAAGFVLNRAVQVSDEQNGMPELFEAFTMRNADGVSMAEQAGPEFAAKVAQAREQAKAKSDRFVRENLEPEQAKTLMAYESDIDAAPGKVTMERLVADMGKFGAVGSAEKAASLWARAQASLQRQAASGALMASADNGTLWQYDPKEQKAALDAKFGPLVQGLVQASQGNDPAAIALLTQQLMQGQSKTGSTEGIRQLEQYLQTAVTNLPNADGPSPGFQSAAAIYRAMSADPQFRGRYFKEDVGVLMEAFNRGQNSGVDAKTAYADAYRAISPEAKAAAEARTKDPKFQQEVRARAVKMVEGSSWVPTWLGGNGRPQNTEAVGFAAQTEAKSYLTRFPDASEDQLKAHLDDWTSKNYVLDETSQMAVKVPPGLGGPLAQAAVTSYSKDLKAQLRKEGRLTDDTVLHFIPTGTEGQLMVEAWDGTARKALGPVNVQQLVAREQSARILTPEDRATLGAVKAALISGQPLPNVPPALMGKARQLKAFTGPEQAAIEQRYTRQFLDRASQVPNVSFGAPSMEGITMGHKPRIDKQLTASVAREFLAGPQASQNHQGLAASLISAGEEVMLRAYGDPGKGAGDNIGMGYNLKGNATKVNDDLAKAGVPAERIEDVKAGRAELTPDQAKRLLMVAMPRYEKLAESAAEDTQKGLWLKMTAAQRAVMIDIAWQVGDPAQFKKAWGNLAAGNQAAFAEETKVFFTNQAGERVEDKRRGQLRANMLAGIETWDLTLQRIGAAPSSKLQATKVAQK